jgi:hypothetical protein
VTGVILRVVCAEHDIVIARVVQTERGPSYECPKRPFFPGFVVSASGFVTRGLASKHDRRLPEVREPVHVLIHSTDAEQYTASSEYWGTLPAWCPRCRADRWVDVRLLRRTRGTLRV